MNQKKTRKYFTIELTNEMQNAMRKFRKDQGINWGFILRDAIKRQLDKIEKTQATG